MSEEKARRTIEKYIHAFNAQDRSAMVAHLNFPFSWIINHQVRPVPTASDFIPPTGRLIDREGWHHTELDWLEPVQVWDTKAHFKVAYSRFRADGIKYLSHEALWIITSDGGHWGIQCMSLYIPAMP